ncbi:MAG: prolyl oligopeptidase family serine peptidase [Gemmatimonadetes bacterium]|nr:prolyl oligopeptidase family serine peptidase [Gemmatimonadota bacterium]
MTPGSESAQALMVGKGVYKNLAFDDEGNQVAFLSNRDEFESDQPAFALYRWKSGEAQATEIANGSTRGVPAGWWVSENGTPSFSKNGTRLFFGTAPRPAPDPEEEVPEWEKVVLDVWNWKDPLLQPNQLVQRQQDLRRTYRAMVDLDDNRVVQLATINMPTVTVADSGDGDIGLAVTNVPYLQRVSWDSPGYNDVYVVDVNTGRARMVLEDIQASARLSPGGKYITWWDGHKRAWFAKGIDGGEAMNLTGGIPYPFYNELHDRPMIPGSNGSAGWTQDDERFLVYDKHDIWAVDPAGRDAPRNITEGVGRRENLRFRYVALDRAGGLGFGGGGGGGGGGFGNRAQDVIEDGDDLVLSAFDLESKSSGFYRDRVRGDREPRRIVMEPLRFGTPQKAKDADVVIFTRESFREFPDVWASDLSFVDAQRLSHANPQQDDYDWGSAELVDWTSTDGLPLQGLLYKPDNFDPNRKYPMMVYYYEKNSDQLHAHRAPSPGSSSINISFYVSRGYIVFIPDIFYRDGYPGESALNCLVPGVLSIIAQGYIDPDRVGAQGHSWGGYQNAYLVTRTNIFAAVEAGAPVSNMTSAYGGIRWQSGRSRAMQYEKTQSRMGGSLWEARPRYIENSPIFWADKVETPVLMMHNDEDGAVPWYQGIEFFVALRRLHQPVWMLNYNGEAHGLRKYQNRKDFAVRMQQFFDHYLMGAPAPVWMEEGIPAVKKGKDLGLRLVRKATTSGGGR